MELTEFVKEKMRESVKACAEVAHGRSRGGYVAARSTGRPAQQIREVEELLSGLNEASNRREREFFEESYARYGGDPAELPWAVEEAAEARRAARRAAIAARAAAELEGAAQ